MRDKANNDVLPFAPIFPNEKATAFCREYGGFFLCKTYWNTAGVLLLRHRRYDLALSYNLFAISMISSGA